MAKQRVLCIALLTLFLLNIVVSPVLAWPWDGLFTQKKHELKEDETKIAPPLEFKEDLRKLYYGKIKEAWLEAGDGTRVSNFYNTIPVYAYMAISGAQEINDPQFNIDWRDDNLPDYEKEWHSYGGYVAYRYDDYDRMKLPVEYRDATVYRSYLGYIDYKPQATSRAMELYIEASFRDLGTYTWEITDINVYKRLTPRIIRHEVTEGSSGSAIINVYMAWLEGVSAKYIEYIVHPTNGAPEKTRHVDFSDGSHPGSTNWSCGLPYDTTPGWYAATIYDAGDNYYQVTGLLPYELPTKRHWVNVEWNDGGHLEPDYDFLIADGQSTTIHLVNDTGYVPDYIDITRVGLGNTTRRDPPADMNYTILDITSDINFYANFTKAQPDDPIVSIHVDTPAFGDARPRGDARATYGKDFTVTFLPNQGYEIDTVTLDGEKATVESPDLTLTIPKVMKDHTVHVSYKELKPHMYTVTADATKGGEIVGDTVIKVAPGGSVTITAQPTLDDYDLLGWKVNDSLYISSLPRYTINNVQHDYHVTAMFMDEGNMPFPMYSVPQEPPERFSRVKIDVNWLNYTLEDVYNQQHPKLRRLDELTPQEKARNFIWSLYIPTPYELYTWLRGSAGTEALPASKQLRSQLAKEAQDETNPISFIVDGCEFVAEQEHTFMQYILSMVRDNPFLVISNGLSAFLTKVVPGLVWNVLGVFIMIVALLKVKKTWLG